MLWIPPRKSHAKPGPTLVVEPAGRSGSSLLLFFLLTITAWGHAASSDALMAHGQLTRREFLVIGGTIAAGTLAAGPASALSSAQGTAAGPQTIYRLSLRGRRGSKGTKIWNANLRFATMLAADQNRARQGDNSRIVQIVVSTDEYDRLFTSRNSEVADLRTVGGPVLVGDCDRDGRVVINELVRGVNIALDRAPVSECAPFDRVANGRVTVDELVRGVRNALD